ncbi:MAG: YeeE/YedE family protein [Aestuariivirga sp.]|nr:YeeE/YedE family protein [Aestuariivirga sp.]
MTDFTPLAGAAGGLLIGLSAVILLGGLGRIAGVSGIFRALITGQAGVALSWQALFLLGLLLGPLLAMLLGGFDPASIAFPGNPVTTVLGGLLVGAGTALGAGCTSGHGICGLARLSARSITATITFMVVAIVTVYVLRHVAGA